MLSNIFKKSLSKVAVEKLTAQECTEILTVNLNPSQFPSGTKYDEESLILVFEKYKSCGGDPEYFTSGAGAPGNCCIQ